MSKIVKYTVAGVEGQVDTLREVSEILGKKVTKAMIKNGEVPEVTMEELGMEDKETTTEEGTARIYTGEDEYEEVPLVSPLDHKEEIAAEETTSLTEEEEAKIEEIINGEDTEENIEEEVDNNEEDTTIVDDIDESNSDTNNDDSANEPSSNMGSLLERMRELYAKKQAEAGSQASTGKGKRTTTIKFTGEFPEVGAFAEKKQLQKFYKQLTDEQLDDWLELEGLTYNKSDNEPINRMRKCMAILALHFPSENKGSGKKKSKYADYSTEQLLEMALENDVEVKETKGNDERILRMYTIVALKKAGILN